MLTSTVGPFMITKQIHRIQIYGSVIKKEPLTGDENDMVRIFPITIIPARPTNVVQSVTQKLGYSYVCLEYNIDEGWCDIELNADNKVHTWLKSKKPDILGLMVNHKLELKCVPESLSTA